ncbi:MAG: SAM-dependent methyltransferase [Pseudomonadota bacterium]
MSLEEIIRREIAQSGPISVARYMELCLAHPEHGYYTTRDPFGRSGDFTTAPEISQMFGEMIGVWVASVWQSMGCAPFRLIELGPGRGTLMADVRRVLSQAGVTPETWLVELSPVLRTEQARRVPDARWAEDLSTIPAGPSIVVANEFFDALPVRQYVMAPDGAREVLVGIADEGALTFGLAPRTTETAPDVDWDEQSPAGRAVARQIAERLNASVGGALIIDYGFTVADRPSGPTLQAVRGHQKVGPLETPGRADLTTLVDFDRLAGDLAPLQSWAAEQGEFLVRLGIGMRAEVLAKQDPTQTECIASALERLTMPDAMGRLFKVLATMSPGLPTPPGFGELHDA